METLNDPLEVFKPTPGCITAAVSPVSAGTNIKICDISDSIA